MLLLPHECILTVGAASVAAATRMTVHEHRGSLAQSQLLLLSIGLAEDGVVCEQHDRARYPERDGARDNRIDAVHLELAAVRILQNVLAMRVRRIPTSKDGNERQQCRRYPGVEYHDGDHFLRYGHGVFKRLYDCVVSEA